MSETKHTPGLWADIKGYITVRSGACIATVNSHNTTEGKANARLIASAPDLLALVYQYRDDLRHPPAPDSRERRLEAIEAAIRKAEGSLT